MIRQADWGHLERIYKVNVISTLYCVEKMQMLNEGRPYKVVVTASAMAHIAIPGYAIYASTKAALHRFTDAYRWQLDDPRKIMLVYPISTRTGFFQAAGTNVPIPWPCQSPHAVARSILRGIRRDSRRVYPSTIFRCVQFLDRFLPMHWLIQKIEQGRMATWLARNGMPGK